MVKVEDFQWEVVWMIVIFSLHSWEEEVKEEVKEIEWEDLVWVVDSQDLLVLLQEEEEDKVEIRASSNKDSPHNSETLGVLNYYCLKFK